MNFIDTFPILTYSDEFVTMFGFGILLFALYHGIRIVTTTEKNTKRHAKKGLIVSSLLFGFYLAWIFVYAPYSQSPFTQLTFIFVEGISDIESAISISTTGDSLPIVGQIINIVQTVGLIFWVIFFMLLSVLKTPLLVINWFEKILDGSE